MFLSLLDRNVRIDKMKADMKELEKQNEKLRRQDDALRKQYDKVLCIRLSQYNNVVPLLSCFVSLLFSSVRWADYCTKTCLLRYKTYLYITPFIYALIIRNMP